jgi:hypothetical protein
MNRKMTLFALGVKCGFFAASEGKKRRGARKGDILAL